MKIAIKKYWGVFPIAFFLLCDIIVFFVGLRESLVLRNIPKQILFWGTAFSIILLIFWLLWCILKRQKASKRWTLYRTVVSIFMAGAAFLLYTIAIHSTSFYQPEYVVERNRIKWYKNEGIDSIARQETPSRLECYDIKGNPIAIGNYNENSEPLHDTTNKYSSLIQQDFKDINIYDESFPFLLAKLLPPQSGFSMADPLSGEECLAIFVYAMWAVYPEEIIQSWYSTEKEEYLIPVEAIDVFLSQFLACYDAALLNDCKEYDKSNQILCVLASEATKHEPLNEILTESIVPYQPLTAKYYIEDSGLAFQNQDVYEIVLSITYSNEKINRQSIHIIVTDSIFQIGSVVSISDQ